MFLNESKLVNKLIIVKAITLLSSSVSLSISLKYNAAEYDYCIHAKQPTVILIIAYNRPEYLKQCITAIEKNPEASALPFIFALDGGELAQQQENLTIIENSVIKNKIYLVREYNYGCPKNHIDAKRFAFDWCKANRAIIIEDDILVTPNYISFLLNLDTWARSKYKNIGAVQGWSYCYLPINKKLTCLNLVKEDLNWWSFLGYCISKETWDKIKHIHYEYEKFIDLIPKHNNTARSKPQNSKEINNIRNWARNLVNAKKTIKLKKSDNCIKSSFKNLKAQFTAKKFHASQDNIMGMSLWYHDMVKIHSVVNRVSHIGEKGISTNKKSYESKYSRIKIDFSCHKKDHMITNFKILNNPGAFNYTI